MSSSSLRSRSACVVALAFLCELSGCLAPDGNFAAWSGLMNDDTANPPVLAYFLWNLPLTYGIQMRPDDVVAAPPGSSFSIEPALPSGLAFDVSTGQISGTPTATLSSANYTVTATDANGDMLSTQLTISVNSGNMASWQSASPFSLQVARTNQTMSRLNNGDVLVVGGVDSGSSVLSEAELCVPGGGCNVVGSMSTARSGHRAIQLQDGTVLIVGGADGSGSDLTSAEIFNPQTQSFTLLAAQMVSARSNFSIALLTNGQVLIAGGTSSGQLIDGAEIYDPSTQSFSATGPLETARQGAPAVTLQNGSVLVVGGNGASAPLNSLEIYTSGSFSMLSPTMDYPRSRHTATLLPNGNVLIAGGCTKSVSPCGSYTVTTVEIFNPLNNSFVGTSIPLGTGRSGHTATLLADGEVLLAGGEDDAGNVLASSERFDPMGAGSLTPTTMTQARESQSAAILPDGSLLLLGGIGVEGGSPLASTELFSTGPLVVK